MNSGINIIEELFAGHARIAILRLLSGSDLPLTGRQVAELSGVSQPGAARALEHLAGLGVVSRQRVGRAILHELNRESLIVDRIVIPVFDAEGDAQRQLRDDLAAAFGESSESVVLFGSEVHNEAGPGSDVDVLLVAESQDAAEEIERLADSESHRFYLRHGKPLSAIVVTPTQLVAPRTPPFVKSALKEGELLSGKALREIIDDAEE